MLKPHAEFPGDQLDALEVTGASRDEHAVVIESGVHIENANTTRAGLRPTLAFGYLHGDQPGISGADTARLHHPFLSCDVPMKWAST